MKKTANIFFKLKLYAVLVDGKNNPFTHKANGAIIYGAIPVPLIPNTAED